MATSRYPPPRFSRWYVTVPRRRHTEDRSVSRVSAAVNVNTTAHELIASARKHRASSRYGPPISNILSLVPFTQPPSLSTQPPPNPTNSRPFPESCRRIGQCLPMFDPSVATCLLQCLCVSPFTSLKAASRTVTSLARREIITAPCSASLLLHAKWGERTRKAVR